MSQNTESVPFRTKLRVAISNFLQKYRGLLLGLILAAVVVLVSLAVWTQIDSATRVDFAEKIEKSQLDFETWQSETDATKKAELAKTLETELADVQSRAAGGYGLAKAWFLQGSYWAAEKKWAEAAKAYRTVYDREPTSYLAPIALVNAGVSWEEAGDSSAALGAYDEFEKKFSSDPILAPQVFFTKGRILESQQKQTEALASYQKLLDKYPDTNWTKLGRDRILLLSRE